MAFGKLSLQLLDSDEQIRKKILVAYAKEINVYLKQAAPKIKVNIQKLLLDTLINTPEYESMTMHGSLQKELGLDYPTSRLQSILGVWINSVKVEVQRVRATKDSFFGGLTISMIHADYSDVTNLPDANVLTDKGEVLPWLQWLLEFGDRVIIYDYEVYPKIGSRNTPGSRSGLGIMIKPKRRKAQWGVPTKFAGTYEKNWVTRALSKIGIQKITKVIREAL